MIKICKDGRIYGQNNKEAGDHLGILTGRKKYIKKGRNVKHNYNPNSIGRLFQKGDKKFLGRHHSEETKAKIRLARKSQLSPRLGKHNSESANLKNSLAHRAEKHPNWRGGISRQPYAFEFNYELKMMIRKRDNFICQECGHTEEQLGYPLRVHHIDYDKKNNETNNLLGLCRSCHAQTNYKREDWVNYFNNEKEKLLLAQCNNKF